MFSSHEVVEYKFVREGIKNNFALSKRQIILK